MFLKKSKAQSISILTTCIIPPLHLKDHFWSGSKMVHMQYFQLRETYLTKALAIDPRDGVFTYSDPLTGDILLETIEQGTVDTLVKQSYLVKRKCWSIFKHVIKKETQQLDDGYLKVSSFEISQDAEYLMLWTNVSSVCIMFCKCCQMIML